MKNHQFNPGDLIRDKNNGTYGIVIRVNDTEIIVGWQDVECSGWDTYPDEVDFVAHIPAAKAIDKHQALALQEFEKRSIKRDKRLFKLLEKARTSINSASSSPTRET